MKSVSRSLTVSPVDLVLRNDDLARVTVLRAGDRMLQDTDSPDDLALRLDPCLTATGTTRAEVAWISDDLFGLDCLSSTGHANKFTVSIGDDLRDLLVKHVGSTIDGTETGEGLR